MQIRTSRPGRRRSFLLPGATVVFAFAWLLTVNVYAQVTSTPTPAPTLPFAVVEVRQPTLTPGVSEVVGDNGWRQLFGKDGYVTFVALNKSAEDASAPTLAGEWRPTLSEPAYYRVEAYLGNVTEVDLETVSGTLEGTATARYIINHAEGTTEVLAGQRGKPGTWLNLGTFLFDPGSDQTVLLTNETGAASRTSLVAFSALRFTPVDAQPTATPAAMATATATPTATTTGTAAPPTEAPTSTPTPSPTNSPVPPPPTPTPAVTTESTILEITESAALSVEIISSGNEAEREGYQEWIAELIDMGETVAVIRVEHPAEMVVARPRPVFFNIEATNPEHEYEVTALVQNVSDSDVSTPQQLKLSSTRFNARLIAQAFGVADETGTDFSLTETGGRASATWEITPAQAGPGQGLTFFIRVRSTDGELLLANTEQPPAFMIDVSAAPVTDTIPLWLLILCPLALVILIVALYLLGRRRTLLFHPHGTYLREMIQRIDGSFSMDELRDIGVALGIADLDSLAGTNKPSKIRELVLLMDRQQRLAELVDVVAEERPRQQWPAPPEAK